MLNLIPNKANIELLKTKIAEYLSVADLTLTPMHISQGIFRIVQAETGVNDPYIQIKKEANEAAMELVDKAIFFQQF